MRNSIVALFIAVLLTGCSSYQATLDDQNKDQLIKIQRFNIDYYKKRVVELEMILNQLTAKELQLNQTVRIENSKEYESSNDKPI